MSRTAKTGKRKRSVKLKTESVTIKDCIRDRHSYGRTEKIRRRNRKTWTRLGNKRRRAIDKTKINED